MLDRAHAGLDRRDTLRADIGAARGIIPTSTTARPGVRPGARFQDGGAARNIGADLGCNGLAVDKDRFAT